jgi:hypothetical protein
MMAEPRSIKAKAVKSSGAVEYSEGSSRSFPACFNKLKSGKRAAYCFRVSMG